MRHDLLLTATNQDTESWRIGRLADVNSIYLISLRHPVFSEHRIASLDDHKGELTVGWVSEPEDWEKLRLGLIWELLGELKTNVIHSLHQPS